MDPTDLVMEHLFGRVLGHHNSKSILESFTKLDILNIHDFLCTDEFGLRKSDQCILNIFKDFLNYVLNDEDLEYFSIPADAVFWLEITPESFKAFRRESFKSSSTKPTVSNDQQSVFESPNFRHRPTIHFESSARDVKRNETRSSTLGNISIQTINPAFKKAQKITEFPTFSGQVKDWKAFERRFVAIANSQNYGHVLMLNPPFEPGFDQLDEFKLDCNYIFQAFSAAWSDGSNYNIVSDHEHTRDGRAVYMNALRYFRSAAFTQIELQDSISSLVNNKLLHSTHDGAEGYNSKFNEYVTIVQKAGVHLDPTLIKCLYLANIQDELYITIKDQTGLENLSLLEIQSLMLKKYTQSLGQRREGAPRFYRQHLVSTNESQVCTPDRPTQHTSDSSTQLKLAHQPLGKPSNNNNTDPFYFDPKDWAAFSPSTREKILLLKGKLREVNIKTLSTAEETENLQPENADPFKDILSQFMIRAHRQNIVQTRNTSKILKQVVNKQYGRLISDSGADTGAISDTYAHILEVHDTQVSVDGCHPNKIETYNLCNGVVAVDLNRVTYLLGIREVPLIPNSVGVLLSELQARAHGTHVDSKPRCFGGSGCIIIKGTNEDEINIPLNLEHGLMTYNDLCHGPVIEFDPLDHTGYVSDESQVQNSDDRQIMDDSPVELDHLQDATLADTDDTSRWKMSAILTHKEVGPHRTELEVQWDTGEISWLPLSVVKRAEPLLFGEYALKSHGPWANHYRKKRRQLLTQLRQASKQNSSSKSHVYKYGVRIPRSAREAHEIDKTEGNTLWGDAILKEINKINEYEVFKPSDIIPEEYTKLRCNMIFDVKLDGTRKARLVVDGSHSPCTIDAYSSVIAPEHVRLAMVAGTLNNLLMETIDLGNAYLHTFTKELVYTILSDGYGQLSGKILIIQKALYGMRTSGARFHEDLSETLLSIGFKPSKADSDLWIRQGQHCYEYIARYVDDLMIFAKDPASVIKALGEKYPVQAGSENLYLGGDIIRSEGHMFLNAKTYIKNVCSKIENLCELTLKHFDTPMATDDHPETDDTTVLDEKTHSIYRLLIGSAQWTITLGRFDIMYAVATLSRFAQVPHQGHFDRMLRVFGYLKYHADLGISMNPIISSFPSSSTAFNPQSWKEQYPNAHEEIPDDAPTPLGRSIKIVTHVDASHASNLLNRRSTTGFIVLANGIPVYWHSKEQHTIETSTFGSEIVAGRIAAEKIMEYRYKLRMMGIPIDGPAILFCDNKSVVTSCSVLSSSLKKRHNALAYHKLRECVAADIIHIFHVPGKNNIADILTKPVDGTTFKHHRGRLLSNPTL